MKSKDECVKTARRALHRAILEMGDALDEVHIVIHHGAPPDTRFKEIEDTLLNLFSKTLRVYNNSLWA